MPTPAPDKHIFLAGESIAAKNAEDPQAKVEHPGFQLPKLRGSGGARGKIQCKLFWFGGRLVNKSSVSSVCAPSRSFFCAS